MAATIPETIKIMQICRRVSGLVQESTRNELNHYSRCDEAINNRIICISAVKTKSVVFGTVIFFILLRTRCIVVEMI